MTNEPELLAELLKANETLNKLNAYAKFANEILKISIALGAVGLVVLAIVFGS
jgi:hypothetical protein